MEIYSVIRKSVGEPWLFLPKDNIVGPVACSAVLLVAAIAFAHMRTRRLRSTDLLSKETLEPQATKTSNPNKDRRPGCMLSVYILTVRNIECRYSMVSCSVHIP